MNIQILFECSVFELLVSIITNLLFELLFPNFESPTSARDESETDFDSYLTLGFGSVLEMRLEIGFF